MKNKWILFGVAIVLIVINLVNGDFSVFQQLSPADFAPLIVITLVSILLKAGVLSGIIIGLKNCGLESATPSTNLSPISPPF